VQNRRLKAEQKLKKRENLGEKGYKEIEVKKGLDHVEKKFRPRRKKA
jgi:hypothetical protein